MIIFVLPNLPANQERDIIATASKLQILKNDLHFRYIQQFALTLHLGKMSINNLSSTRLSNFECDAFHSCINNNVVYRYNCYGMHNGHTEKMHVIVFNVNNETHNYTVYEYHIMSTGEVVFYRHYNNNCEIELKRNN